VTIVSEPATDGRFTREELLRALAQVCARAGLDPTGARLLRFTNNAVFRLATRPVVVRIVGSRTLRHRVDKVVAVASWLAEHDVPAVRLLPGVEQPVWVGEHVATLWQAVSVVDRRLTGGDLARLLRRLHALPAPPFPLPTWDPLDDVRRRLADAEELDPDDQEFLQNRCAELEAELAGLCPSLPWGPVHGDAHLGNLIPSPSGPVLCDFDSTCVGPREWDLIPVAVGRLRMGQPADWYRELAREYGFDVIRWPGFGVLRQIREIKLVTSALPIVRSNPAVRPELQRRLRSFRAGDSSARWSPFR